MDPTTLLSPLIGEIGRHPLAMLILVVAWWGFSGAVGYPPAPQPMGSKVYAIAYGAAHGIAGNVAKVASRFTTKP